MITYCENAVKLIRLVDPERVQFCILHTGQTLIDKAAMLDADTPEELGEALEALAIERAAFLEWYRLNQ